MANPVMNYNQFMSKFKGAAAGYTKKADIKNDDAKAVSGEGKETTEGPVKGAGTTQINKYTKEHLAKVKSSNVVGNGKKK